MFLSAQFLATMPDAAAGLHQMATAHASAAATTGPEVSFFRFLLVLQHRSCC